MAWGALAIPFFAALVLWLGFKHKVSWWEILIPIGLSACLILAFKNLTEHAQCSDTEYWTTHAVKASYDEPWNEMVTRTETYTETVGFGKKAKTETRTRTVREVVYHSPRWYITDNNKSTHYINQRDFERITAQFGNKKFVNLWRSFHTINGNRYETTWAGDDASMEVVCTSHQYQNRVVCSDSIFKFQKVSQDDRKNYNLFEYPAISGHSQPCVLGWNDSQAERMLSLLNAKYGKSKQIRLWALVFKDQPIEAAMMQMNHWQGGNKNELVLTIGVDSDSNVTWAYVFSWTEKETFKLTVRDAILEQGGQKLDLTKIIPKIEPLLEGWERKHFKDFNYLSVEPPLWSTLLIYGMTLGATIGLSLWLTKRE